MQPAQPTGSVVATNQIEFVLNGRSVRADVDYELMLLNLLRDEFDITSPKDGCQPMGQCGCCAVMMDGKVVLSCVVKAKTAAGKRVTTLEGKTGTRVVK